MSEKSDLDLLKSDVLKYIQYWASAEQRYSYLKIHMNSLLIVLKNHDDLPSKIAACSALQEVLDECGAAEIHLEPHTKCKSCCDGEK